MEKSSENKGLIYKKAAFIFIIKLQITMFFVLAFFLGVGLICGMTTKRKVIKKVPEKKVIEKKVVKKKVQKRPLKHSTRRCTPYARPSRPNVRSDEKLQASRERCEKNIGKWKWKKGQSGNVNGRKKLTDSAKETKALINSALRDISRGLMNATFTTPEGQTLNFREVVVKAMLEQISIGNFAPLEGFLNRMVGHSKSSGIDVNTLNVTSNISSVIVSDVLKRAQKMQEATTNREKEIVVSSKEVKSESK